jgi:hypothetical protein
LPQIDHSLLCASPPDARQWDWCTGPWTFLCRAPRLSDAWQRARSTVPLTILCGVLWHVAHDKDHHHSRACSAAHGRERVTPSPCGRPWTPFLCRAPLIPHGKELCRALAFPKAHDKGLCREKCAVRPLPCAWAKSARQRLCRADSSARQRARIQ